MKLDEVKKQATQALEVSLLPERLKEYFKKNGWKLEQRPTDQPTTFDAIFSSTPEGALGALAKATAFMELHDMTWGGRNEGTALYEVRGDGMTYFAEVRFWSIKRKPTAQINFYEG